MYDNRRSMGEGGSVHLNQYEQAVAELKKLRRAADEAELAFSAQAAEVVAMLASGDPLDESPVTVIKHECRLSFTAAARAVCVGEQAERLPESIAAMLAGKIGFSHLALMAYTARALTESKTALDFSEVDLLKKARRCSVAAMIRACAQYRQAMDPEAYVKEALIGVEARFLRVTDQDDGALVSLAGLFEAEAGALVRSALEPLASRQGDADDRSRERRLADALVELVGMKLDSGLLPRQGGVRPHLQVSATLESLAGVAGAPAAELELGMPLSKESLRRLSCDCSLTRVLLGANSCVIDVGRARRTISGAQRRALLKRDQCCRFPGCDRPGRFCEGHHLKHWASQGETVLANLVLLCRRHHFLVHEGGWVLDGDTRSGFVAIPPQPWWLTDLPAA